jgi:hypothetical protein
MLEIVLLRLDGGTPIPTTNSQEKLYGISR